MIEFLKKIFGSKREKDVEALWPLVDEINERYETLSALSDEELRGKTAEFKSFLREQTSDVQGQLETLRKQAAAETDPDTKENLYKEIDALDEEFAEGLETAMREILPEAFAVVKETARRFAENGGLRAKANDYDRELAKNRAHIRIDGDDVIYDNEWSAAGAEIKWNMIHYDVQLIGGIVLHEGKIAEMATGEGKTLVATLPVYLNALTGQGVHLVTVNDYLARRDAEWNAPLFQFHGLTVDCIDLHQPNSDARRAAYNADITYGTNNEFGFDYLRDNMTTHLEFLVQRKHFYSIVDEIDSVLIDEARTPLIISGPVPKGDKQELYVGLKPRIEQVVRKQNQLVSTYLDEARKLMDQGKMDDAGSPLFRAYRGLPKNNRLISMLSEPGATAAMRKTESFYLQNNAERLPEADEPLYFTIDEKQNQVEMTEKGRDLITRAGEDENFFVLPDVAAMFNEIERKDALDEEEKIKEKDQLAQDFTEKSERLHAVNQLLKAYTLFEKDVEYIVQDNKVNIVDEQTGRVLSGRRYSDGLHQAIEAKENVKVEAATQTFATVTLQNYFRMYHKLAGMTGTAETEESEFFQIYKLDVVVIPTNRPIARDDREDMVFKTKEEKYEAVIEEIREIQASGRPILVGTTSVDVSEHLSRLLRKNKIEHEVLNAKQHQREADIVAQAGQSGAVTVATNMAGRGTDIKLSKSVLEAGGLAIIGTERHESRRIDRQLRGRAGRQGDPGSSQFYVSLEDDLMRLFNSDRVSKIMDRLGHQRGDVIQHSMVTKSIGNAQRKVEENNFAMRKRLLEYDDVMNNQREVIYRRRRNALYGDRVKVDLDNMLFDLARSLVDQYIDMTDAESLRLESIRLLSIDPGITENDLNDEGAEVLAERIYRLAKEFYQRKAEVLAAELYNGISNIHTRSPEIERILIPFSDGDRRVELIVRMENALKTKGQAIIDELEKVITLRIIDDNWKDHLRNMDELRQSAQNAVFEQKDPLLVYKFESFQLFQQMLDKVNRQVLSTIFKADLHLEGRPANQEIHHARDDFSKLKTRHDEIEQQRRKQMEEEKRVMQAGSNAAEEPKALNRRQRRARGGGKKKRRTMPRPRR